MPLEIERRRYSSSTASSRICSSGAGCPARTATSSSGNVIVVIGRSLSRDEWRPAGVVVTIEYVRSRVLLRDLSARRGAADGLGRTEGSGCSAPPRRLGRDDDASWRSQFSILSFELPPPAPAGDGRGRCCGGGLVRWSMVGASCPDGWVVGGVWRPEVRLRASSEGPELHTTPSSRPSCHDRAAGLAASGDVVAQEHLASGEIPWESPRPDCSRTRSRQPCHELTMVVSAGWRRSARGGCRAATSSRRVCPRRSGVTVGRAPRRRQQGS